MRFVYWRYSTTLIGGIVGGGLAAVTALIAGLDWPLGYAILGAIVAGISAFALGPSVATRRPLDWFAIALLIQVVGVLAFPIAGPLLGLEAPWLGPTRGPVTAGVAIFYPFAPVGFLVALPFVPAALTTGVAAAEFGRRITPGTPAGSDGASDVLGDARFHRRVVIAGIVLAVLPIVGYVLLTVMLKNASWGY